MVSMRKIFFKGGAICLFFGVKYFSDLIKISE